MRVDQTLGGGVIPTLPLQFLVKEISLKEAKPFIEKWHYSQKVPTGKNIFFGWFDGDELYAVADYGIGVNAYQASFLTRETGKPITNQRLLELKRLCRKEPKNEALPLTKFLKICHALLKRRGYQFIVSLVTRNKGIMVEFIRRQIFKI